MTDTTTYKLNHSMIRVSDPEASLKFYQHLGMSIVEEHKLPDYQLNLYFLAFDAPQSVSHGKQMSDREGVLELSYSYDSKRAYSLDQKPSGFGYIAVSVDSLVAACKRLADAGYRLLKEPDSDAAIALDPDGYKVKVIAQGSNKSDDATLTNTQTYKLCNTMLHVKEKDKALEFYTSVCCMKLINTVQHVSDGSTSYFLGYSDRKVSTLAESEGLLELVWRHDTEEQDRAVYHDDMVDSEGFGHICISVDDITNACKKLEEANVSWKKRLFDGPFRVAFILDPDGYEIEVIQNEKYKPANHDR